MAVKTDIAEGTVYVGGLTQVNVNVGQNMTGWAPFPVSSSRHTR